MESTEALSPPGAGVGLPSLVCRALGAAQAAGFEGVVSCKCSVDWWLHFGGLLVPSCYGLCEAGKGRDGTARRVRKLQQLLKKPPPNHGLARLRGLCQTALSVIEGRSTNP